MAEAEARMTGGEDPEHRAWREQVEREYHTLMRSLLVERQRPTPKRSSTPRDASPTAGPS